MEERNLLIFKDTPTNNQSMESSRRDLFIHMVVDSFVFKMTKFHSPPVSLSYPKQVWDNLNQRLVFTKFLCDRTTKSFVVFKRSSVSRKLSPFSALDALIFVLKGLSRG